MSYHVRIQVANFESFLQIYLQISLVIYKKSDVNF